MTYSSKYTTKKITTSIILIICVLILAITIIGTPLAIGLFVLFIINLSPITLLEVKWYIMKSRNVGDLTKAVKSTYRYKKGSRTPHINYYTNRKLEELLLVKIQEVNMLKSKYNYDNYKWKFLNDMYGIETILLRDDLYVRTKEYIENENWDELRIMIRGLGHFTKDQLEDVKKIPVIGLTNRVEENNFYKEWRLENILYPFE